MASIGRGWPPAILLSFAVGAGGCGGVDNSEFTKTPGSASSEAGKTPQDVDAKIPNLAPKTNPKQKRDI